MRFLLNLLMLIPGSAVAGLPVANPVSIEIVAPARVRAGAQFIIQVKLPAEARPHSRIQLSPKPAIPPLELLTKDGQPVFLVMGISAKTTCTVFVQIPKDGLDPVGWESTTISVEGKSPDPDPEPGPKPNPSPQPGGPYWVIFLEESGQRTPEMARVVNDAGFLNSLNSAGHKWRVYDDDQPGATEYTKLVSERPALIITAMDGQVIKAVKLPSTTSEINELLKGGAK